MKKHKQDTRCTTPHCKNKRRVHRTICSTCDKKNWRKANIMKASFQTLRHNATRRGKVFTITFEYFQQFCYKTNYIAGKGRQKESYTIDRIDSRFGYVEGNIQMLTKSQNSSKKDKVLVYDWETKYAKVV